MKPADGLVNDSGLQAERTLLAWRRTALSVVVGSLAAARILPAIADPWWAAMACLEGLTLAGLMAWRAQRRYENGLACGVPRGISGNGGGLLLAVAGTSAAIAATTLGLVAIL